MSSLYKQLKWYVGKKTGFLSDYKLYKLIRGFPIINVTNEEGNNIIRNLLLTDGECLIARVGATELDISLVSIKRKTDFLIKYPESLQIHFYESVGFFPLSNDNLDKFGALYSETFQHIDILASWRKEEKKVKNLFNFKYKVDIRHLESFRSTTPWTKSLENKKVLVINPFENTIKEQYKKRQYLFEDKNILPHFELITYKPVVSHGGAQANLEFENWFDALSFMCSEIKEIDFDIALIGAGAYGLPLGKFIKDMGKKAVVLGGITQLFFGIKGTRWDNTPIYNKHYNENWVRPSKNELPPRPDLIEGGAYF